LNKTFVLDCSIAMAWFFAAEATPACDKLLDRLNTDAQALVANHWPLEVGNALLMGERRKRCTPADTAHFLEILAALSIESDKETGSRACTASLSLARRHKLTLYDSAYLELAMRRNLPLATLDKDLRNAARKSGVEVLPERI
jgi:predicted nucleic acid-binding protein